MTNPPHHCQECGAKYDPTQGPHWCNPFVGFDAEDEPNRWATCEGCGGGFRVLGDGPVVVPMCTDCIELDDRRCLLCGAWGVLLETVYDAAGADQLVCRDCIKTEGM